LECIGLFKDGEKDSTWLFYDSVKGNITKLQNWFEGRQFGEQKEFYSNGKIKEYQFNNVSGKKVFEASFDENQKINHVKGFPIYIAFNRDALHINEVFDCMTSKESVLFDRECFLCLS
jgi:hypothetical protein